MLPAGIVLLKPQLACRSPGALFNADSGSVGLGGASELPGMLTCRPGSTPLMQSMKVSAARNGGEVAGGESLASL